MRGGREKPFIVYESLLKRGSGSKRYFRQIGKLGLAPEIHAQRDMSDVKSTRYGREFIRRGALVQCLRWFSLLSLPHLGAGSGRDNQKESANACERADEQSRADGRARGGRC